MKNQQQLDLTEYLRITGLDTGPELNKQLDRTETRLQRKARTFEHRNINFDRAIVLFSDI